MRNVTYEMMEYGWAAIKGFVLGLVAFQFLCATFEALERFGAKDLSTYGPAGLVVAYSFLHAFRLSRTKQRKYPTHEVLHVVLIFGVSFLTAGGCVSAAYADKPYAVFLPVLYPISYLYGFLPAILIFGDMITPNMPSSPNSETSDG